MLVSDIAILVLKRDVKLQPTNRITMQVAASRQRGDSKDDVIL